MVFYCNINPANLICDNNSISLVKQFNSCLIKSCKLRVAGQTRNLQLVTYELSVRIVILNLN